MRNHKDVEAFVTQRVKEHLDGLMGRPYDPDNRRHVNINHMVGQGIRTQERWVAPDREDTLEAFLAVLYSNYPYDSQAFDSLPARIRDCALQAAPLSLVKAVSSDDEG
ncbi:hypothetical protein [Streptomyces syringium]|uniref:hypothetical protein n=1 Tax=Streptomyces syringium TaxID=76729 RepID=UPI0033A723F0